MGAHESKSDDELFIGPEGLEENLIDYIQQNDTNEREENGWPHQQHEQEFMNELHKTVIPDQNHISSAMNEMDSHNMFSSDINKNCVTVPAFNVNVSESNEEIDNSILNDTSELNKGVEIERDLQKIDSSLETHNPSNENNLTLNKSVVLYKQGQIEFTCHPKTQLENTNLPVCDEISNLTKNAINSEDEIPVINIKRELLTEEYNLQIENPDEETNVQLFDSIELNEITNESGTQLETSNQNPINTLSTSEIISFRTNSIVEVNDLLADSSCINEKLNLIQNREIKTELLNIHASELENTEVQLLIDENGPEVVNITQPFPAANNNNNSLTENSSADDPVISSPLIEVNSQGCIAEAPKIRAIELYPINNTLLVTTICDKFGDIENPSQEIIEVAANENSNTNIKESEKVCNVEKLIIIEKESFQQATVLDGSINKDILKIKIEQIELANNETQKISDNNTPVICDIENLKIIEKVSYPKSTVINEDILNIEDSHKQIKIESELVDENSNTNDIEPAEICDNLHLTTYKDILNVEISNKTIKLANNETPKIRDIESVKVCDALHLNNTNKEGLPQQNTLLTDTINEDILNAEVANKTIKIEQIELADIETSKTPDKESSDGYTNKEGLYQQNTLLADNINDDIFNVKVSKKPIKIEQIEPADIEITKTTDKDCYNENVCKCITDDILSIAETKKTIKIEQIELCNNENIVSNIEHLNIIEKGSAVLDKNYHDDILSNEVSHKKIKIEIIQLDIDENSNTNVGDHDIETAEVCNAKHLNNIKEIKIEPIIIDVDEISNNNIVDVDEEDTDKENVITNSILNENTNSKPLNIDDISKEIKIESNEDDVIEKSKTKVKETVNEQSIKYNFVKNPFAFFKNLCKPTEKQQINIKPAEKFALTNILSQDEIIIEDSDDELEITDSSTAVVNVTNVQETISENEEIPLKTDPISIITIKTETIDDFANKDSELLFENTSNLNDVHIKREQIEECLANNQSPAIDKNEDILNASLDVNVDNLSLSDVDENFFSQSANDLLSNNSTQITSPTSSEYYSIKDILSLDDFKLSDPKSNEPTTDNKQPKLQGKWRGRPKGSRDLKPRKHRLIARQTIEKNKSLSYLKNKSKDKSLKKKPKNSQKYSEKDSAFSPQHLTKNYHEKTLPKIDIVTRTKEAIQVETLLTNNKEKSDKEDFPKPFKLEMTSNAEKTIAKELPKPIVYKMESSKVTPAYNTREFQPHVRLKRLKSPDLLVPLKIRKISNRRTDYKKTTNKPPRKSYPFVTKSTSQHSFLQHSLATKEQHDFQIQQAYSLNPRLKLHRWSMDQDSPFENNSRVTTPSESKYFTPQELYTLFQSSTPNASSRLGGRFNSAVSSSTPISDDFRHQNHNKTLLLEIAAERAFINNHLLHFGFSPIHFELFNDMNDLNVFLKFLFGHLNSH